MTMNSVVVNVSLPQLIWIGDAGLKSGENFSMKSSPPQGDLYFWGNSALRSLKLPRLADIYGKYFVSANPLLKTIDFSSLANVRSAPAPSITHSDTAVCDFCTLCGLAQSKPGLTTSANTSVPLAGWSSFSSGCSSANSTFTSVSTSPLGCNTCYVVSPTPGCTPTPSISPSVSLAPSVCPSSSSSSSSSSTCNSTSNVTFHYNPACGGNTSLPDIGNSGLNRNFTDLSTSFPTYGTWPSNASNTSVCANFNSTSVCTYFHTPASGPWFSSSSARPFAKALTGVSPTGGLTIMFWLRTPGSTNNFQMVMSTRLTNNVNTPQIEGSLKGWNIYVNTNFSTNPAWYSEGNGPYLGWLSFWWSQCGNVSVPSNPLTHGWRKFHILNLNSNSTDLNKFMHIAIVYDNSARVVSAYKNGVLIRTQSETDMGYWPKICAINDTDVYSGASALRYGSNNEFPTYPSYPANVDLGDIRIYNSAVSETEIASAFSKCVAG